MALISLAIFRRSSSSVKVQFRTEVFGRLQWLTKINAEQNTTMYSLDKIIRSNESSVCRFSPLFTKITIRLKIIIENCYRGRGSSKQIRLKSTYAYVYSHLTFKKTFFVLPARNQINKGFFYLRLEGEG